MNTVRFTSLRLIGLTLVLICLSIFSSCSTGANRSPASDHHSTRIVVLGDSHLATYFGRRLDRRLRTLEDTSVNLYSSASSIALWWWTERYTKWGMYMHRQGEEPRSSQVAQTPQLLKPWKDFDDEMRRNPGILTQKPTHVIVTFGANYWGKGELWIEEDLKTLISKIKDVDAKCFLITHPDTRAEHVKRVQEMIVEIIQNVAKDRCGFFDSTKVTKYPEDPPIPERPYDGIHYNRPGELQEIGEAWADAVFKDFSDYLKK